MISKKTSSILWQKVLEFSFTKTTTEDVEKRKVTIVRWLLTGINSCIEESIRVGVEISNEYSSSIPNYQGYKSQLKEIQRNCHHLREK
jgi:hypothetical protein